VKVLFWYSICWSGFFIFITVLLLITSPQNRLTNWRELSLVLPFLAYLILTVSKLEIKINIKKALFAYSAIWLIYKVGFGIFNVFNLVPSLIDNWVSLGWSRTLVLTYGIVVLIIAIAAIVPVFIYVVKRNWNFGNKTRVEIGNKISEDTTKIS
jgi:hypothetical protein